MNRMTSATLAAGVIGLASVVGHAAITPLDSSSFSKKFEMTVTGPNELDPLGNTNEWSAIVSTGGGATASLGGGNLNYDSSVFANRDAMWESITDTSVYNNASGSTIEVRVRLDNVAPGASSGNEERGFDVFLGDDADRGILQVFRDRVAFAGSGTLVTVNNADGFHTFRVAQDANTNLYQVWRDGVQIGTDLVGGGAAHNLFFGDGSGDFGASGAVDYFRFTAGGFSPIPEPASLGLLAISALALVRRRA